MQEQNWSYIIRARSAFSFHSIIETWHYRDLLWMFVKRDIVTNYKQTILGPLWFFIQPVLTTLTYLIIFNNIANIKTGTIPAVLFYLSGISMWNYFSECLTKTSATFKDNAHIFGKVYFPRLILPLSVIISNLLKFFIQFGLFLATLCFYFFFTVANIHITLYILLFPLLIVIMGALGLGLGMIITSLTTKYKDLTFLIQFGVQLLMYATPVIYPLSLTAGSKHQWLHFFIKVNPMTTVIETFRKGFLGEGIFSWTYTFISMLITFVILFTGFYIFSKTEKSFTDTV